MSDQFQTLCALVIVAFSVGWLAWRARAQKKNPGCGSDCGCASQDLKARIKR